MTAWEATTPVEGLFRMEILTYLLRSFKQDLDKMRSSLFRIPFCLLATIIADQTFLLPTPPIVLFIYPINRTVIPCFLRFYFLHKALHCLHIHLCLFQCTYPVLWYNLVLNVHNPYILFRLHIPESCQPVIRSPSVEILIHRNHLHF